MSPDGEPGGNGNGGTRQRLTRGERNQLILDHAIDVFGHRGYHNTSMDDVAEQAGISKALVYQHFESKDELYMAVLRAYQEKLRDSIVPAWSTGKPPRERFWEGLLAFFTFVEAHKEAWGVLYRDAVQIENVVVKGIHEMDAEIARHVSNVFQQEIAGRELDPAMMAAANVAGHAVVGACHTLADYWLDHPDQTARGLATVAMNVMWLGFERMLEGEPILTPADLAS